MVAKHDATVAHIRAEVRMVATDDWLFRVLSCGERIAVAPILDRYDLIERAWGTIAEGCPPSRS